MFITTFKYRSIRNKYVHRRSYRLLSFSSCHRRDTNSILWKLSIETKNLIRRALRAIEDNVHCICNHLYRNLACVHTGTFVTCLCKSDRRVSRACVLVSSFVHRFTGKLSSISIWNPFETAIPRFPQTPSTRFRPDGWQRGCLRFLSRETRLRFFSFHGSRVSARNTVDHDSTSCNGGGAPSFPLSLSLSFFFSREIFFLVHVAIAMFLGIIIASVLS